MRHFLESAAFGLLALSPVVAQSSELDRFGGAIPGPAEFVLEGPAGAPYVLILALELQTTPLQDINVTIDISDDFAMASFGFPGFAGLLAPSGSATATLNIPNLPELTGLPLYVQAVTGDGTGIGFQTSDYVQLTLQESGTFLPAADEPALPIVGGTSVVAADGDLLFVGGSGPAAQRWDRQKESFSLAGASFGVGLLSQSTALADGRVLFTGGLGLDGQPTDAAAIYDPSSGSTANLTMIESRAAHGAALLGDGRVLITGGIPTIDLADPLGTLTAISGTTEIFDPSTDTFAPGPALIEPRALHTATTLTNGDVLIAGGFTLLPVVNVPTVSPTAYRFSQATGSFGLPALMQGARAGHSAIALPGGRALLVGGLSIDFTTFLTTGNIQDLVIGTRDDAQVFRNGPLGIGLFSTVGGLSESRAGAGLAMLPSGEVLVAGGFRLSIDLSGAGLDIGLSSSADVYMPSPDRFEPTGDMEVGRLFPLLTPLQDGRVLVVGGGVGPTEVYQR